MSVTDVTPRNDYTQNLQEMTPAVPMDDSRNGHLRNTESLGDADPRFTILSAPSDFPHLSFRQLCHTVGASTVSMVSRRPALARHVRHVVPMRAEKQMIRIDAARAVALVQDTDAVIAGPLGNLPYERLIGGAMSGHAAVRNPDIPVAIPRACVPVSQRFLPKPASSLWVNLYREQYPLSNCHAAWRHTDSIAAKMRRLK